MIQTRTVIITGANGGIGKVLCASFKEADYFVAATDVSERSEELNCDFFIKADLIRTVEDDQYAHNVFQTF